MLKSKPVKDEEALSGSDTTSEGPSITSKKRQLGAKKRQLGGVCQFPNHSNFQPRFLTFLQSDEQIAKKAKTGEVACGSVCSISCSLCISHSLQDVAGVSKEPQGKTLTNSEGEKYIDLGKKKRATVRSFKGIPLLDIREFYGADGQEKPGKKGISLTLDQARHSRYLFIV